MTFRNNAILPTAVPAVTPNSTLIGTAVCNSSDVVISLKKEGFPVIDGHATIESSGSWFVLRVKNNWHKLTGWSLDELMNRLGKFIWCGGSSLRVDRARVPARTPWTVCR